MDHPVAGPITAMPGLTPLDLNQRLIISVISGLYSAVFMVIILGYLVKQHFYGEFSSSSLR